MQKAVIYIRVSTEKQATEGYSLDSQVERCTLYAKNKNFQIDGIYRDEGISGTDATRPALLEVLKRIDQGDVDALIVYDISRLSRDSGFAMEISSRLKKMPAIIHSVTSGGFDKTPEGEFYYGIQALMAAHNRANLIRTMKTGSIQKAKKGGYLGGSVLGYDSINKKLAINEDEAKIVKLVYDLYIDKGYGLGKIAKTLNNRGYKTKRGKMYVSMTIVKILENPLYVGRIKREVYDIDYTKLLIDADGDHEPIIPEDQWNRAQRMRSNGSRPSRVYEGDAILSGVLKCPQCGAGMVIERKQGGRYRYYRCLNSKSKGKSSCNNNMINADNIEKEVDRLLMEIIKNKPLMKKTIMDINKGAFKTKNTIRDNLRKARGEREALKKKRTRVVEEILDKVEYESGIMILNQLSEKEKEVDNRISNIEKEMEDVGFMVDEDKAWEILAERLPDMLAADLNKKKNLTRLLFDSIYFTIDGLPKDKKLESVVLAFDPEDVENIFFDEKCVPVSTSTKRSLRTDTVKIEISPVIFYRKSRKSSKGGI